MRNINLSSDTLLCPCCNKGDYLHHDIVEIFERREDSGHCLHTLSKGGRTITKISAGRGNPSMRRHGVAIGFFCEHCGVRSKMTVAQEKGQTLVEHCCTFEKEPGFDDER